MDARLDAELGGPGGHRLLDALSEVGLGMLVGIGGALGLAEATEGAADHAHVGDVDVAVHDKGDGVAGQPPAQLVGGDAHVLDDRGTLLGKQRRELLGGERRVRPGLARRPAGPHRRAPSARGAGRCPGGG